MSRVICNRSVTKQPRTAASRSLTEDEAAISVGLYATTVRCVRSAVYAFLLLGTHLGGMFLPTGGF